MICNQYNDANKTLRLSDKCPVSSMYNFLSKWKKFLKMGNPGDLAASL